jgi:type II secretory pathway pseudopilin PulG
MKQGGANRFSAGFTIVETLIVLAITGVMLLSVIGLVSGKQNKTEFQQGINDAVTQLQQTAREVAIGYYPGLTDCSVAGSSLSFHGSDESGQGTNNNCVFLGKVVQFGVLADGSAASVGGGTNERYPAYTLAGCQFKSCSTNASSPVSTSFADAKPMVVERTSAVVAAHNFPTGVTNWYTLENGLSTVSMSYTCDATLDPNCPGTGANPTRAFGFLQSFGTYGCNGGLCSGSQHANLYGINVPSAGDTNLTKDQVLSAIDTNATHLVQAQKVTICLRSGTTNQSGLLTIGSNTNSVSVKIFDGGSCGA